MMRLSRVLPVIALFAAACGGGVSGTQAERVVCVSKQINEFMFAIGAQNVLVGRDLTSIYPPAILKITSVGYHRALNAEGIISLRPTLFLNDGNYGPQEVTDQLQKVGIPILTLKPGESLAGAESLLDTLGKRFHREPTADSVLAKWKVGMDSVLADTLKWVGTKRPRVLIIHFGQIANNYLALKRGSVGDQMLQWTGAENAVDSVGGMMRLTPELIAKAAPDIIIATDVGFDRYGSAAKFATMPGVSLTPAGKSLRIYRIEETDVMYYGPRTPDAVRRLEAIFHPPAAKK
ncbi:MAG TPA: ABC transporter substrate-binding protein [Gemmatimonadaceae bacterium]